MATVDIRRQSAERLAVSQRNYRRARDRALVRLAHLYEDDYKALLAEEKARDKETGMAWDSLDRSPLSGLNASTAPQAADRGDTSSDRAQGNDGGQA